MTIECYDSTCKYHGAEGPFCDEDECRKKVGAATHEKEFEKWFANRDWGVNGLKFVRKGCKEAYLAGRQKDEKERALIREVVKEGLDGKLSELSALYAIHTIVNPVEPDKDDLEWARDSRARGGGTNNEREKSEGSEEVGLEGKGESTRGGIIRGVWKAVLN